ncbi:hypothetical protein P1P75_36155 [Streptomyces sp. ID05-39B]|uniref:hypothetical protein n=1 Tax=Streptomyces sp. ID05-39B TaxID=3028664 RepID=UPI0029B8997C|nr:hypothetical protein [Streptomyces sp. ID05-39B]MDX3531685.1 hypothetical protein [Streptomyces sp. ID05-39B]
MADLPERAAPRPEEPAEGPSEGPAERPAETEGERRRRRAQFLRDLAEARELRDRVQPRRAKTARLRHAMRMRTFRW